MLAQRRSINPSNPHDASKHHYASPKNDLISRFWTKIFMELFQ